MIRVIIYGFGFMGRVHAQCFSKNPAAEVVAVVDEDVARARVAAAELGLGDIFVTDQLEGALSSIEADVLDICLPTDAHAAAAEAGFAAGLHVFCEKPIALSLEDAARMTAEADLAGKQLMVGHCLRFWPECLELKQMLSSGEAGPLRALNMFRRAPRPDYTAGNWISDPSRCLGAALDLHIHDTDFVHFLLGTPDAVFSGGVKLKSGWDHIQTQYVYADGPLVQAEGGWTYPLARPFQMGFCALFENGSLDFDNTAVPALQKRVGGRTVDLTGFGDAVAHGQLAGLEGYQKQLEYFISRIATNQPIEVSTGKDATASLATLLSEIRSAETRSFIKIQDFTEYTLS